jgi:hypothetical protein
MKTNSSRFFTAKFQTDFVTGGLVGVFTGDGFGYIDKIAISICQIITGAPNPIDPGQQAGTGFGMIF